MPYSDRREAGGAGRPCREPCREDGEGVLRVGLSIILASGTRPCGTGCSTLRIGTSKPQEGLGLGGGGGAGSGRERCESDVLDVCTDALDGVLDGWLSTELGERVRRMSELELLILDDLGGLDTDGGAIETDAAKRGDVGANVCVSTSY